MGLGPEGNQFSPGIKHKLNEQDLQAWKEYLAQQEAAKQVEPIQDVLLNGENPPPAPPAAKEA